MIVLHREKIIALKARKVGGTSFEIALSKYANQRSIITPISASDEDTRQQLGWRGPQNYKASFSQIGSYSKRKILSSLLRRKRPLHFYNHIPATEARQKLGEDIRRNYTKIAIIRNPFDYMISLYFWIVKEKKQRDELSFEEFVLSNPEWLLINKKIYEINGKISLILWLGTTILLTTSPS